MENFRKELESILTYFLARENLVLFVKRMVVLMATVLIVEIVASWFNFSVLLMLAIVMMLLICFSYTIGSYLVYKVKEAKEAIKEIIVMIKNL